MNYFRKMLVCLPAFLVIVLFAAGQGYASDFNAIIYPELTRGGEGFLLFIEGAPENNYEVLYNDRMFVPYSTSDLTREICLPVPIDGGGRMSLTILEHNSGIVKELHLDAEKRKIEILHLRNQDETMRDKQPSIEEEDKKVMAALRYVSPEKYWDSEFIPPLEEGSYEISTEFALKKQGKKYSYFHKGVDLAAPIGLPVKAMNDGKVILSGKNYNIYGNIIFVDHGQGVVSCYFHMNKAFKEEGNMVLKDEIIGEVGSTGWSTGPHLHFGVYLQGQAVDPFWWTDFSGKVLYPELQSMSFSGDKE